MGCGVYAIKNTVNNKMYIGSSTDLKMRKSVHISSLRGGYHSNDSLQSDWNKYGEQSFSFDVIEFVSPELLVEKEAEYVIKHKANMSGGYNYSIPLSRSAHIHNKDFLKKLSNGKMRGRVLVGTDTEGRVYTFNTLWDAAEFIINKGYSKAKHNGVRAKISEAARNKFVNNGSNGSKRLSAYGFKWKFKKI